MTIERYKCCDTSWDGCTGMWEDEEGDYIKYFDHIAELEKLNAEIAELKAELKKYTPFKCAATDTEDSEWRNL